MMKRFGAALALGLFVSFLCFAQTQTGNASYNPSKTGFTIAHPSLSFNTRVRVTNLRNNVSVEASVNGRIPITAERIADIARDAGDALEMGGTGMTLVEIEVLPPRQRAGSAGEGRESAPLPEPPPAGTAENRTPPAAAPREEAAAVVWQQTSPPPAPAGEVGGAVWQQPVQTITETRYLTLPGPLSCPAAPCSNTPLLLAILCLLLFAIALLIVILVLLLRRREPCPPPSRCPKRRLTKNLPQRARRKR